LVRGVFACSSALRPILELLPGAAAVSTREKAAAVAMTASDLTNFPFVGN
jgi:hypothetical protein